MKEFFKSCFRFIEPWLYGYKKVKDSEEDTELSNQNRKDDELVNQHEEAEIRRREVAFSNILNQNPGVVKKLSKKDKTLEAKEDETEKYFEVEELEIPKDQKRVIVMIPQGCYGYWIEDENSPKNVIGLGTEGIASCCAITVHTRSGKNIIFLAHVDESTDILDSDHGIPGWINFISNYPGNESISLIEIAIHYGQVDVNIEVNYQKLIDEAIQKIAKKNDKVHIQPSQHHECEGVCVIFREDMSDLGLDTLEASIKKDKLDDLSHFTDKLNFTVGRGGRDTNIEKLSNKIKSLEEMPDISRVAFFPLKLINNIEKKE